MNLFVMIALHFPGLPSAVGTEYLRLQFRVRIRTYNLKFENLTFV